MNYYGPRELTDDGEPTGTYHYTRRNDSRVWPLGYCAGKPETTREEWDERMGANAPSERYDDGWDSEFAKSDRRGLRAHQAVVERFGEKFHEHGHDTEEDAVACYTEYCLDVLLAFYDDDKPSEWRSWYGLRTDWLSEPVEDGAVPADVQGRECQHPGCETIVAHATGTINPAGSTGIDLYLCSEHCTRESVAEFWTAPSASISSF